MTKSFLILTSALILLGGCNNLTGTSNIAQPNTSYETDSKIDPKFLSELEGKMRANKLNGFSLAISDNYELVYSKQWGIKADGETDPINANTAFSSASTSKAVTALICAALAERGLIDLDAPISNYLTRWSLPENEFTKATPLTWTHLLAHMGGTTQHGFADFYEGDEIPTLIDSVEGRLPRYDKAIDITFEPGTDWSYSGGGYTIIQMALEDHLKRPLHELADEIIFHPLGMTNTTMKQPNEAGFPRNVAKVHDRNGNVIRSGLPITPQVAASGMWSTPEDLTKLALALQKALRGDQDAGISPFAAKRTTDIISLKGSGGSAMGWLRGFGFGHTNWIRHDGSNTGVGNELLISPAGGYGVAFFANGEKSNRFPITSFVRNEVINMMQWEKPVESAIEIPKPLIEAIQGPYKDFLHNSGTMSEIKHIDGRIYLNSPVFEHFLTSERSEMIYLGENTFKILDYPNQIRFNLDSDGNVKNISMMRDDNAALSTDIKIER